MKELSLNILDVTENSVSAGAKNILVSLIEDEKGMLTLTIKDNGCGMTPEVVKSVIDPFYTTRTTRKVGLGVPLLKLAAEQTGGKINIESEVGAGTTVTATFDTKSIDFTPIGDMTSTLVTLIMGAPDIDFEYVHQKPGAEVALSTMQLREVLGDVSLGMPEVLEWIREYLTEQYKNFGGIN
ncbi:MAG: ATP-binding protein [Ruminococcaceae bacterium]|nr:ATP-binding protein [Oscillospiraceae bacterium]